MRLGSARWIAWWGPAAAAGACLAACHVTRTGASEQDLARAHDQTARGAALYSDACARCHGRRGEGRAGAPAILGASALPEFSHADSVGSGFSVQDPQDLEIRQQTHPRGPAVRGPFRRAQDLFDFLGGHYPEERVRSWGPEDSWAVVTFLLAAHGCSMPQGGIDAGNAAAVSVQGCGAETR